MYSYFHKNKFYNYFSYIVDQLNDAGSYENTKRTPLPFCNPLTNFDHLNGGRYMYHENTKLKPLPFCKPLIMTSIYKVVSSSPYMP